MTQVWRSDAYVKIYNDFLGKQSVTLRKCWRNNFFYIITKWNQLDSWKWTDQNDVQKDGEEDEAEKMPVDLLTAPPPNLCEA